MMKLIITGTRTFNDYDLLKYHVDKIIRDNIPDEIVSRGRGAGVHTFTRDNGTKVHGADGLGERYAKEIGVPVKSFISFWWKFGKQEARKIRNEKMVAYATDVIVFWDGHSPGTRHMIKQAKKINLNITVINYLEIQKHNLTLQHNS